MRPSFAARGRPARASLVVGAVVLTACFPDFGGLTGGAAPGPGGAAGAGGAQAGSGGQGGGSGTGGSAAGGGQAGSAGGSAGAAGSAGGAAGGQGGDGGQGGSAAGGSSAGGQAGSGNAGGQGGSAGSGGQGGGGAGSGGTGGAGAGGAGAGGAGASGAGQGGGGCQEGGLLECAACGCVDGVCKQTTLASGADADVPWAVVASSNGLYWTNRDGGAVMRSPPGGGGPTKIASALHPRALVTLDDGVVWTDDKGLWVCSKPDCSGGTTQLAQSVGGATIQGVVSDGQTLFWTEHGPDTTTNTGSVFSCPLADCSSPKALAVDFFVPQSITLDGDWVIWANRGTGQSNGSIYKKSKSGSNEQSITAAIVLPTGLAADDTYVYWTEGTPQGKVWRCPHTTGYCDTPEEMAPAAGPQKTPLGLSLAGGRLYWSSFDGGTIQSCPAAGCKDAAPKLHVSGRDGVRGIWVNSSCLFWADSVDGGTVAKVRR